MRLNRMSVIPVLLMVAGIVMSALRPVAAQHLWNVDEEGDTLRYVNIFAPEGTRALPAFPRYMTPEEYRQLVSQTGLNGDSITYQSDVHLLLAQERKSLRNSHRLRPQYDNIWKPVLALTLSGTASVYFKLRANSAYERYSKSIDRNNIETYYDLTRKYDTYSAVSFVILQFSFGWLSYKLLW